MFIVSDLSEQRPSNLTISLDYVIAWADHLGCSDDFRTQRRIRTTIREVRECFDVLTARGCEIYKLAILSLQGSKNSESSATSQAVIKDKAVRPVARAHGPYDRVARP